jgi:hypothetical protein
MKTLALVLALTLSALPSDPLWAQTGGYLYVSKVEVKPDNNLWIDVSGNFTNSNHESCVTDFAFAASDVPLGNDRARAWLQIALASLLTRSPVYVVTAGCMPDGHPIFRDLQVGDGS